MYRLKQGVQIAFDGLVTPMKPPLQWFPADVIAQFDIMNIVKPDGFVYVEIQKGMYRLKQAARIAF